MNAATLALIVFAAFAVGYRFYSRFLAEKIFALAEDEAVPAHEQEDGIDFVPTDRRVLLGHHYSSIAGAAPIVGPALAVIWGWLPALIWVCVGTVCMGAVHDFSALVISLRHKGRSIGDIAGSVLSPRIRVLALLVISFLIWIVLAVFAFIIATLFRSYPNSIFPINVQILLALGLGWVVHRRGVRIFVPSLVIYVGLLAAVFFGDAFVAAFPAVAELSVTTWVWILLLYCFVASVLPVWLLLQPRDLLNAHQLVTALVLLVSGLFVLRPEIQAPAWNPSPEGAPSIFPFLFITIACGAISGFHGLVASGTTSKQVARMPDARLIGYGGMLGEGALGLLAVLATTAGFATRQAWDHHYASWGAAQGLPAKLEAFVGGGARFLGALGIPLAPAETFMAVVVIAFAATSLDTGARIQRLVISELGTIYGVKPLENRFIAGALGIGLALLLAVTQAGGKGGLILWPLFGTTNQLLAAVTLLLVSVWLKRQGKPARYTLVPLFFVGLVTILAMLGEIAAYWESGRVLLLVIGVVILACDLWILGEGLQIFARSEKERVS